MAMNVDRLKKDLDRLISQGDLLHTALIFAVDEDKDHYLAHLHKVYGNDKARVDEFLAKLPSFSSSCQAWYSESLAVLRQILPDRVSNLIGLYGKPKSRKFISYSNYVIHDYLQGITVTAGLQKVVEPSAALPQYQHQLDILRAASIRFESSLFEIRQLVQADLFDGEIDAARELLKHKFSRAACAIAGVILEKHLRQVCDDHGITVSKRKPGIADLNELLKANSVIDVPQWRHISLLGDIRNLCDHNKQKEPTVEQVTDLIDGTDKVLKTIA
jgi:hypothetical protein